MFLKKKPISASDEARLIAAIKNAEFRTSGEIRVHIANYCKGDALELCKQQFKKLNMHQTKERNAILFYIALRSKTFAVWGDEGIHQKVNNEFWAEISNCAVGYFKKGEVISGLEKSIELCGEKLKLYFPYRDDDKNELLNDISYNH